MSATLDQRSSPPAVSDGRRPLVIGNWKMNGDQAMAEHLLSNLQASLADSVLSRLDLVVCPPYPYLALCADRLSGARISWGAQDVSAYDNGAFTGEVSAAMLFDLGCRWTLVGHSERRTLFGETDGEVARKARRALESGVVPVICLGETLDERESGATEAVLARQVDAICPVLRESGADSSFVFAYEPVWAIGTGRTATAEQVQAAHAFIRARLVAGGVAASEQARILYGGSVKPGNAAELFTLPDVDGGLIGGASLVAADFIQICAAAASRS